jgi:peptide-methionine (S)-S-oxide reductase
MASTLKQPVPSPLHDTPVPEGGWPAGQRETAVFAGGCFWGVQSVFQRVKGVEKTIVGYSGGDAATANYRTVCGEGTGHAEAIEIHYDPSIVSYGTLLRVFFSVVHDPTQLNRQGADVGTSYRSAIFFTDESQRLITQAYVQQLDAAHIYAIKNPHNSYIQVCDIPKIAALEQQFPDLFQDYVR